MFLSEVKQTNANWKSFVSKVGFGTLVPSEVRKEPALWKYIYSGSAGWDMKVKFFTLKCLFFSLQTQLN